MNRIKKFIRILSAIVLGMGAVCYIYEAHWLIGIILLITAICIWPSKFTNDDKTKYTSKPSQKEANNKGGISFEGRYSITNSAAFSDGTVYYVFNGNVSDVLGYYDMNGNIYDRDKRLIGITEGERVYMERSFEYEWLKKTLPNDSAIDAERLQVSMKKYAGTYCYSYIEVCEGGKNVLIAQNPKEGERENLLGACAAYIACLKDGLLVEGIDRFYYTIQKECYFRDKNPDWNAYYAYQKKLWFEKG